MKVYRQGRRGRNLSKWSNYSATRDDFADRLRRKGPYYYKLKGQKRYAGPIAALPNLLKELDKLRRKMSETDVFWTKVQSGSVFVFDVGEEHIKIPAPPAGISASIVKAHNLTFTKCEELDKNDPDSLHIVTMGYTVCKLISGTRVPSQHCPGPPPPAGGNAMDWVVKRGDGSVDIAATDTLVAYLKANGFPEVLWRGVPSHYPNHAHTSGNPKRVGWPPCL